ncbi:c-type cytochrome [Chitinophaga japonensis]|nr:c-type cytochrome [Chitinophaga japonensis]
MKEHWFPVMLLAIIAVVVAGKSIRAYKRRREADRQFAAWLAAQPVDTVWRGTNASQIPAYSDSGQLIAYGHALITNTARYLGPRGAVARITNGMNCQNCHLDGGTRPFGNNFGRVYATYPQFRARNNGVQSIYARINDCLQRSLNGQPLDSSSREMQAIYAYMQWLGGDVPKGVKRGGTGIKKPPYLDRAADPAAGRIVYNAQCRSCHGSKGQGQRNAEDYGYTYPPLWGPHSYNDGAGLYRLGNFAGFVKYNMPFGTDYHHPQLTDEEAWDVAAFVNSQPRPHKDQSMDWKNVQKKPVDFPFGPYADTFPASQHKYGPFIPILKTKTNE